MYKAIATVLLLGAFLIGLYLLGWFIVLVVGVVLFLGLSVMISCGVILILAMFIAVVSSPVYLSWEYIKNRLNEYKE